MILKNLKRLLKKYVGTNNQNIYVYNDYAITEMNIENKRDTPRKEVVLILIFGIISFLVNFLFR